MRALRTRLADEGGFTLVLVLGLIGLMAVLSVTLIGVVQDESTHSRKAVTRDDALQAAEAGVDDYIAKLVADHLYYAHYVHAGEATRRGTDGTTASHGAVWTGGLVWTYPNRKDAWRRIDGGYEYDLQITAPSSTNAAVQIISTGRPAGSNDTSEWRTLQTLVRPSSITDFQMVADADIQYGPTTTTYGKVYAGIDSKGVAHSISHLGVAYANLYAEGSVSATNLKNGAVTYDRTTIRSVIKNPVNFNDFLTSLSDIQRASQSGGIYLNNAAVDAWKLTFMPNGTVTAQSCMKSGTYDVAQSTPNCNGAITTYNVPTNGAIYVGQTAIVLGQVNGRVTVASKANVVVGGNITYILTGDDVLGLVAQNDVVVAEWAPYDLSWRGATIAQSGTWHSWSNTGSHGTLTYVGSTATYNGGYMNMFKTRIYQYDDSLLYLQPPWFPTVEDAYTVLLSRELPATT